MTKVVTVKCVHCKKDINRDTAYKIGTKSYYCDEHCYKNHQDKPKAKPKKDYKPKEGTDRRSLTDYVQELYLEQGYDKKQIPWNMIMSQVSNILAEHEVWTYVSIQYILWYMHEIEEIDLFGEESKGSIMNLVPYYGSQAEDYYNQSQEVEEAIEGFDFTPTIITIKKNNTQYSKAKPLTFD